MKRIGILTYFWADNPGTFLQAYATQQAFAKKFPDDKVEIVNYKHRHVYFKPGRRHINPLVLWRDLNRYFIFENAKRKYLRLSPEKLISKDYKETLSFLKKCNYDVLVSGADTILQYLDYHYQRNEVPIYWLSPELKCTKILCGSSCRALTYKDLTAEHAAFFKQSVNDMQILGVRDEATFSLIRELGLSDESKLHQIPDPTFSLEIDYSHAERFIAKKKLDFSKPGVLISLPPFFELGDRLAAHFKAQGYRVFVFGHKPYADVCIPDISPFEWAGIYRYFDKVVTDRFHGTVFSILNKTPVVSVVCRKDLISSRGESKYLSLWKIFGCENTNLFDATNELDIDITIDKILNGFDAFEKSQCIDNKLIELKNQYMEFIDKIVDLTKTAHNDFGAA